MSVNKFVLLEQVFVDVKDKEHFLEVGLELFEVIGREGDMLIT